MPAGDYVNGLDEWRQAEYKAIEERQERIRFGDISGAYKFSFLHFHLLCGTAVAGSRGPTGTTDGLGEPRWGGAG
jgi:hypothetical protein